MQSRKTPRRYRTSSLRPVRVTCRRGSIRNEILKALSGINLDAIDADIESAFGSRMAELDKMLEGLDDLVNKIEKDIQNLDQPKPDGPQ